MAQLMPLPLTVSCSSKIQIGFTFLVPAHPGSPGQRAIKRVCVCVCVCACFSVNYCFQTKTALLKLWHFCDSGEVKSFRTHLLTYSTRKRCQCSCQTCGADEVKCELLGGVNKSVICKLDADIGRKRRVVKHDGDRLR